MDDRSAAMVEGRQRLPEFTAGWAPPSWGRAKPVEAAGRLFEETWRVQPEIGADARAGYGAKALPYGPLNQAW